MLSQKNKSVSVVFISFRIIEAPFVRFYYPEKVLLFFRLLVNAQLLIEADKKPKACKTQRICNIVKAFN